MEALQNILIRNANPYEVAPWQRIRQVIFQEGPRAVTLSGGV